MQHDTKKLPGSIVAFLISILAGIGALATLGQTGYLLINEKVLCANQGCEIVESLIKISPLWFNGAGAIYFTVLFAAAISFKSKPCQSALFLIRLLLICGIAAEGILISYQFFVAGALCSYCLFLASIIIVMNLLICKTQAVWGSMIIATEILLFSLLQFNNPAPTKEFNIDQGTYAIKQCTDSQKHLYLLFSANCAHCKNVLSLLNNCTQCDIRFNPVQPIGEDLFPSLTPLPSYDPNINATALKILGIKSIPVLIEKQSNGMRFIRGEDNITQYLQDNCFGYPQKEKTPEPFDLSGFGGSDSDECNIDTDCDTPSGSSDTPLY